MLCAELADPRGSSTLDVRARGRRRPLPGPHRPLGRGQDDDPAPARRDRDARRAAGSPTPATWLDTARDIPGARGAPLRLRLPGLRAVSPPQRVAERRLRPARRYPGRAAGPRTAHARAPRPRPTAPTRVRRPCRAGSASGSRSRARSPPIRRCCCSTSRSSALDARARAAAGRELGGGARRARGRRRSSSPTTSTDGRALADEVAVLDGGRIVQRGSASRAGQRRRPACSSPTSPARSCLTGTARPPAVPDGLTIVELDGGGTAASAARGAGRVALTIHPWEVTLSLAGRRGTAPSATTSPRRVRGLTGSATASAGPRRRTAARRRAHRRRRRRARTGAGSRGRGRVEGDRDAPDPARRWVDSARPVQPESM